MRNKQHLADTRVHASILMLGKIFGGSKNNAKAITIR